MYWQLHHCQIFFGHQEKPGVSAADRGEMIMHHRIEIPIESFPRDEVFQRFIARFDGLAPSMNQRLFSTDDDDKSRMVLFRLKRILKRNQFFGADLKLSEHTFDRITGLQHPLSASRLRRPPWFIAERPCCV